MSSLERIKVIIGLALFAIVLIGAVGCVSYLFDWNLMYNADVVFSDGREGGASTTPIFLGLCALAGAYLLNSHKRKQ